VFHISATCVNIYVCICLSYTLISNPTHYCSKLQTPKTSCQGQEVPTDKRNLPFLNLHAGPHIVLAIGIGYLVDIAAKHGLMMALQGVVF